MSAARAGMHAGAHPVVRRRRSDHAADRAGARLFARRIARRRLRGRRTGTPLVCVGESAERRAVVVGFGAADSNLASAPAFPVLMANALEWLARPQAQRSVAPPGADVVRRKRPRITRADGDRCR